MGLYSVLSASDGIRNWVALTGGMSFPTAYLSGSGCSTETLDEASDAINTAEYYGIPAHNLGAGVHPYSYAQGGDSTED